MRFLYSGARAALVAALILLALPVVSVAAQTDLLYGMAVTGKTDASYHISGKEGDLITAEAVGITPDLIPVLSLLDASGRELAAAQNDPLTPGSSTLHARLPLDGDYTLKVTGLYGKSGDFVLSLSSRPITSAHALAEGRTNVNIDATPQAFHFAGPAEIHLISPNGAFSAQIHSQPGDLIAEINDLPSAAFALDSNGEFEMMLRTTGAAVTVEIDYLDRPDLAQTVDAQIATINTLAPTDETTVEAALEGTALVEAAATSAPTATDVSTEPPTATDIPTEQPTATSAPTETATPTDAPTTIPPTPTATIQAAPDDSSYQLTIALGSSASINDVVSYPTGDREDRVFYDISGLDSNASAANGKARLEIKVTCSGTGTDLVTFFAAGSLFHCGDTLVQRNVTSETRSGSIIVTAASGDDTYVEWSLTGSATRAN